LAIKIISGWSNAGGSTVAHINLCNLFNNNGIRAEFYGPHDWHLDKCNGKPMEGMSLEEKDIIITHFVRPQGPLQGKFKKHVLSCHETNMYPLKKFVKERKLRLSNYDFIHFVSNYQKEWHRVFHPSTVIPNVMSRLNKSPCNTNTAGIIGSIDEHKQTHLSIQRAIKDGYKDILIFGEITDIDYFNGRILPVVSGKNGMIYKAHEDDKQAMYDQIDVVYHSSKRETFNYIKGECEMTGVKYDGLDSANANAEYLPTKDILEKWITALEL